MSSQWARALCRLLIALVLCSSAPAQAALIGSTEALQHEPGRTAALAFVARADVARELQALGIDPAGARDRIAALTDDEAKTLSDRINALPAGADVAGILLLVVVVALIWWAWKR